MYVPCFVAAVALSSRAAEPFAGSQRVGRVWRTLQEGGVCGAGLEVAAPLAFTSARSCQHAHIPPQGGPGNVVCAQEEDTWIWVSLKQGLVFANKVLLERGHAHSFTYCMWLLSRYGGSMVRAVTSWPARPKMGNIWPFRDKSVDPLFLSIRG